MEEKTAPKMNFAAIAAQDKKKGSGEETTPLRVVQIDGLVSSNFGWSTLYCLNCGSWVHFSFFLNI